MWAEIDGPRSTWAEIDRFLIGNFLTTKVEKLIWTSLSVLIQFVDLKMSLALYPTPSCSDLFAK